MKTNCQNIKIEKEDHVAVVTFNRPQKLNALSADLMEEVIQAAHAFREDETTRVVIFTGAGN